MTKALGNLSERERRLATLTVVVLLGAAIGLLGLSAYRHIGSLDGKVAQLERELLNLTQQSAQRGSIEAAYREVVAKHSSEMTKEEIHDNLRREIFSLAMLTVPDKKGGADRQVQLVKIPTLREGLLKEEGEGYREYQIQFRIPSTGIRNLMRFLQRIETSKQILRIDGLDMGRSPGSTNIHATLTITRTVLDNPDATGSRVAGDGGQG